jgi:hypothetical protein
MALRRLLSVIYPVCVAHANDRMPAERAVAVSGRLILISGIGSAVGPPAALMSEFGTWALHFMAAVTALFALLHWRAA